MKAVWKSAQYSTRTKLRIYQSCILTTFLYGSECWRMTEKDMSRLSSFHTTSLRRILRIFWPRKISNEQVLEETNQESMRTIITRRRWKWISHVLQKEDTSITKTAECWTHKWKRKRGRPKTTWRRTVELEMKETGHSCGTIERLARDRPAWRNFVAALNATRRDRK
ncbi:uncharacterized protein LOC121374038 [Gigantopelta aegis]|uniref:uncharacterized protein LOC121374038 n=1 Tax=Gigantopelta aegis TaxID=1735272 RepID=UPI001B888B15|nr:uncharacterized protein LOC121374038 [Gigantopelta aegis]